MPKAPPLDDTAETPIFVGGVYNSYSAIGRAVSFAMANGLHVDIAPATPQRGKRQLGLEGPQTRLALPHPEQFNGHAEGSAPQAIISMLEKRSPLTKMQIYAELVPTRFSGANVRFALNKLKSRGEILQPRPGDPYSLNANPPAPGQRRNKTSCSEAVLALLARGPLVRREIMAELRASYSESNVAYALNALKSTNRIFHNGGHGDAYSVNSNPPPTAGMQSANLESMVLQVITQSQAPLRFADIRKRLSRKFSEIQIRRALNRLHDTKKPHRIVVEGVRDARTYAAIPAPELQAAE